MKKQEKMNEKYLKAKLYWINRDWKEVPIEKMAERIKIQTMDKRLKLKLKLVNLDWRAVKIIINRDPYYEE